jgi:magnesium-transporting ATPase (P-type)
MDEITQPTGLSAADVADRMARYGRNELPVKKATSPVTIFLLQIEPVSFTLWLQLLGVALSLFIIDEGHKYLERRKARRLAVA